MRATLSIRRPSFRPGGLLRPDQRFDPRPRRGDGRRGANLRHRRSASCGGAAWACRGVPHALRPTRQIRRTRDRRAAGPPDIAGGRTSAEPWLARQEPRTALRPAIQARGPRNGAQSVCLAGVVMLTPVRGGAAALLLAVDCGGESNATKRQRAVCVPTTCAALMVVPRNVRRVAGGHDARQRRRLGGRAVLRDSGLRRRKRDRSGPVCGVHLLAR